MSFQQDYKSSNHIFDPYSRSQQNQETEDRLKVLRNDQGIRKTFMTSGVNSFKNEVKTGWGAFDRHFHKNPNDPVGNEDFNQRETLRMDRVNRTDMNTASLANHNIARGAGQLVGQGVGMFATPEGLGMVGAEILTEGGLSVLSIGKIAERSRATVRSGSRILRGLKDTSSALGEGLAKGTVLGEETTEAVGAIKGVQNLKPASATLKNVKTGETVTFDADGDALFTSAAKKEATVAEKEGAKVVEEGIENGDPEAVEAGAEAVEEPEAVEETTEEPKEPSKIAKEGDYIDPENGHKWKIGKDGKATYDGGQHSTSEFDYTVNSEGDVTHINGHKLDDNFKKNLEHDIEYLKQKPPHGTAKEPIKSTDYVAKKTTGEQLAHLALEPINSYVTTPLMMMSENENNRLHGSSEESDFSDMFQSDLMMRLGFHAVSKTWRTLTSTGKKTVDIKKAVSSIDKGEDMFVKKNMVNPFAEEPYTVPNLKESQIKDAAMYRSAEELGERLANNEISKEEYLKGLNYLHNTIHPDSNDKVIHAVAHLGRLKKIMANMAETELGTGEGKLKLKYNHDSLTKKAKALVEKEGYLDVLSNLLKYDISKHPQVIAEGKARNIELSGQRYDLNIKDIKSLYDTLNNIELSTEGTVIKTHTPIKEIIKEVDANKGERAKAKTISEKYLHARKQAKASMEAKLKKSKERNPKTKPISDRFETKYQEAKTKIKEHDEVKRKENETKIVAEMEKQAKEEARLKEVRKVNEKIAEEKKKAIEEKISAEKLANKGKGKARKNLSKKVKGLVPEGYETKKPEIKKTVEPVKELSKTPKLKKPVKLSAKQLAKAKKMAENIVDYSTPEGDIPMLKKDAKVLETIESGGTVCL